MPDTQVLGSETSERSSRPRLTPALAVLLCVVLTDGLLMAGFLYCIQLLRAESILTYKSPKGIFLRAYDHFFEYHVKFSDISIPGTSGPISLRIYAPINTTNPAPVVLVHGFAPNGNQDGYLNTVAGRMASMGYLVTLPTVPAETHMEATPSDLPVIGDAIRWTARRTNQQVAVLGISFAGGLVIPAAAQPSVSPYVKLVVSLSGYNNLESIARYDIHERVTDPYGRPYSGNPPGALFVVSPYLDDLLPPQDAPAVESAIFSENHGETTAQVTLHLTPAQRQEFAELHTMRSPQIRSLYLASLARHHAEFAAISPSSVLGRMRIPLYVIHGYHDRVFPEGEVEWMRKETSGEPNVHILVTPWIAHAFVTEKVTAWQRFRTIDFVEGMLHAAAQRKPLPR